MSRPTADMVIAYGMLDAIAQPLSAGLRHRGVAGLICYRLVTAYRRVQIRNKYLTPHGENPLAGVAPAGRRGTVAEDMSMRPDCAGRDRYWTPKSAKKS